MKPHSTILVTGGAGYIGSHTCVELLAAGYGVVILDNFSNSKADVVERIATLTPGALDIVAGDVCDRACVEGIFAAHPIAAVVHFAGLKAVAESVAKPALYYRNNVLGSLTLIEGMQRAGVHRLVFSSSATVYGDPRQVPIRETDQIAPTNPYGQSKAMVEQILTDVARSGPDWHIALLRYFNPVGAHPSGIIGEDPNGIPNNLMPYVAQVAAGRLPYLTVHGDDYPTRDGTGERDYIHVVDLARGHVAALAQLDMLEGARAINLGCGRGATVFEVIAAFEKAADRAIAVRIGPRRPGDVARCFAEVELARELLGWRAELDVERACIDAWRWQAGRAAQVA